MLPDWEKPREVLQADGNQFEYLKLSEVYSGLDSKLFAQQYGSHADEHATSLMLHIAPEVVDMNKAGDDGAEGEGKLSRVRGEGIWSESGVYGQPTLANASKGKLVADAMVESAVWGILVM